MKDLLLEEIKKFKLLSNYNTNLTLTENDDLINEYDLVNEQGIKSLINLAREGGEVLGKELKTYWKDIKLETGTIVDNSKNVLKDADDVIKALKNGALDTANWGRINKVLLKNSTSPAVREACSEFVTSTRAFRETAMKGEQEVLNMLKNKGYSEETINTIMNTYKKGGGTFTSVAKDATTVGKDVTAIGKEGEVIAQDAKLAKQEGASLVEKEGFFKRAAKFTKENWKKLLLAGVAIWAIRYYLKKVVKFSPCVLETLTEEELQSLSGTDGQWVLKTTTGNKIIDLNGGIQFSTDTDKYKSGNGKYSGTYSCSGCDVALTGDFDGMVLKGKPGCEKSTEDKGTEGGTEGGTENGSAGSSKYISCPETFPIKQFCKNETIRKVQGCLGGLKTDSAFGPLTQAALEAKGLPGTVITQDTVDKACGTTKKPEETPLQPTIDVNPGTGTIFK